MVPSTSVDRTVPLPRPPWTEVGVYTNDIVAFFLACLRKRPTEVLPLHLLADEEAYSMLGLLHVAD